METKTLRLQWHVTEKCNWHCRHCYQEKNKNNKELDLGKMVDVLENFINLGDKLSIPFPLLSVAFTGGEPFARGDFIDLLENIKKYKNRVVFSILTNGSFLTKEIIIKLKDDIGIRSIQFSVEGYRDLNDSIRGKGSYDLVKEKIKLLNDIGINAQISLTMMKDNIKDIPKIISDFSKYKVRFNFRRFVPIGKGQAIKKLMLSPSEVKKVYLYLEKKRNSSQKINIWRGCEEGIFAPLISKDGELRHCQIFNKRVIVVMPNGDVYPCRRLPIKLGNIMKEDLGDIYFNSSIYNRLSDINTNNKKCIKCQFFSNCLGGARCVAFAYSNNNSFENLDPQCFANLQN